MCRIAGIIDPYSTGNRLLDLITKMQKSMQHGGPDDEGVYITHNGSCGLGHRRLSIIDLSSDGHQPMFNEDQSISMVFNGEIYNFREIRKILEQKGYSFFSKTDSEVIIKAYQEWGEDSFAMFNGMFAFALEDTKKNLLYLVRDSSGIKPLYYYINNASLIFASEVRAFKTLDVSFEKNDIWEILFLTYGRLPEPYTTLKNVFMLPQGSFLKYDFNNKSHSIKKYFEFRYTNTITTRNQAIELLRETLSAAVERHLISDSPLGIFLSGGIDSSILALLAAQKAPEHLRTLSITFNELKYSEKKYQDLIAQKIQSRHSYYTITEQEFNLSLADIFKAMDQPTLDAVNTYFISKAAKEEGLKVVLSGLGADELLGGYPSFQRINTIEKLKKLPSFVFSMVEPFLNYDLKKLSFLAIDDDLSTFLFLRGLFSAKTTAKLLMIDEAEVYEALKNLYLKDELKGLQGGNKASWLETNMYMKNQLLKDSDVMSMWHSLELRVPFLDKEFIEAVLKISPEIKFSGQPKGLLIDAFKDILPEAIWNRPKQGFTFPFQEWMKKTDLVKDLQNSPNEEVRKLYREFTKGKIHWTRLWGFAIINSWETNTSK